MIVELQDVGRRFNKTWIFRHLNLRLSSPGSLAILGPNGSGKSTLLQLIAGYLSPSEGSISLCNTEDRPFDPSLFFKFISFSGPALELIEEFTLEELLSFQLSLKGSLNNISPYTMLERCGLAETRVPIRLFSSGMKQRLKLLLAFSADTPILLLDEPLMNLDTKGIDWYHEMLETHAGGRIVVVASNDAQEYTFCKEQVKILDYKSI